MSAALPVGWAAVVVALGWRWRPRPLLALDVPRSATSPWGPAARVVRSVARPVGALIRRALRRPPDDAAAERLGLAALGTVSVAAVAPMAAPLVGLAAWWWPRRRARRAAARLVEQVADELPQLVDLLVLAAGAGLTPMAAVRVATQRMDGPIAKALAAADRAVELGEHPEVAFEAVVVELGEPVRSLVSALLASLREGTPLEAVLTRVGEEARLLRRRQAEEAARRVPVRLLFPLVLCTLPAFALLTVVPLVISALGSLQA